MEMSIWPVWTSQRTSSLSRNAQTWRRTAATPPNGANEATQTAGKSGLSYDRGSGHYNYVWKTDKAWAGTCRALTLKLIDGTEHPAYFKFK